MAVDLPTEMDVIRSVRIAGGALLPLSEVREADFAAIYVDAAGTPVAYIQLADGVSADFVPQPVKRIRLAPLPVAPLTLHVNGLKRFVPLTSMDVPLLPKFEAALFYYVLSELCGYSKDAVQQKSALSGATNVISMTLTNNAVLTWLWATNVMFTGAAGPNGSVSGAANGWYPVGNSVTVTAAAASHYHFASWSGDVPVADTNRNPLNVTMDCARSLTASFVANLSLNNTPNWWLAQHGLSTNATGAVHDDGDGVPAWAEWEADTDPTNSASVFKLTDLTLASGRRIFFQSSSNRLYTLEYRTNLSSGVWIPLSGQTDVLGGGNSLQDTNAASTRFYRVRVRLKP